jgi:hypothetical protein
LEASYKLLQKQQERRHGTGKLENLEEVTVAAVMKELY